MKREAQLLKALADETRLRILLLLTAGELCVCELMAALELPQSTVSRHLSYLKNSGWLLDRRAAVWMYYRLNPADHLLAGALLPVLCAQLESTPRAAADRAKLESFRRQASSCGA